MDCRAGAVGSETKAAKCLRLGGLGASNARAWNAEIPQHAQMAWGQVSLHENIMHKASVLIVDDNQDAADMLALILDVAGWDTKAVYGGQQALDAVAHRMPDVVLLDVGMPGMSGLTVAKELHATYGARTPAIVALTAWTDAGTKAACREAGMILHLSKPVETDALVEVLRQFEPGGAVA